MVGGVAVVGDGHSVKWVSLLHLSPWQHILNLRSVCFSLQVLAQPLIRVIVDPNLV